MTYREWIRRNGSLMANYYARQLKAPSRPDFKALRSWEIDSNLPAVMASEMERLYDEWRLNT